MVGRRLLAVLFLALGAAGVIASLEVWVDGGSVPMLLPLISVALFFRGIVQAIRTGLIENPGTW